MLYEERYNRYMQEANEKNHDFTTKDMVLMILGFILSLTITYWILV